MVLGMVHVSNRLDPIVKLSARVSISVRLLDTSVVKVVKLSMAAKQVSKSYTAPLPRVLTMCSSNARRSKKRPSFSYCSWSSIECVSFLCKPAGKSDNFQPNDVDAPNPKTQEPTDEVIKVISQERFSEHIWEQIVDIPVPQILERHR